MNALTVPREAIPAPALVLGAAGLIPFAVPTAVIMLGSVEWGGFASKALLAYGAVILSFLGAVHWGLELRRSDTGTIDSIGLWRPLGWGVMPALIAWVALLLPHASAAVILLMAGFGAQYWADEQAFRANRIPGWYIQLRRLLTVGVFVCLGLTLAVMI